MGSITKHCITGEYYDPMKWLWLMTTYVNYLFTYAAFINLVGAEYATWLMQLQIIELCPPRFWWSDTGCQQCWWANGLECIWNLEKSVRNIQWWCNNVCYMKFISCIRAVCNNYPKNTIRRSQTDLNTTSTQTHLYRNRELKIPAGNPSIQVTISTSNQHQTTNFCCLLGWAPQNFPRTNPCESGVLEWTAIGVSCLGWFIFWIVTAVTDER